MNWHCIEAESEKGKRSASLGLITNHNSFGAASSLFLDGSCI